MEMSLDYSPYTGETGNPAVFIMTWPGKLNFLREKISW